MDYLVQWSTFDKHSSHAYIDNRDTADKLARYHAHRWGGLAVVMRMSDGKVVYRILNIKEEHAAA